MRNSTHSKIVAFHEAIATAHNDINGFYRFNWSEISGKFRSGIQTPALLLESHSLGLEENANKTTTFANRAVSFLILDFTGKADNYNRQQEVLDITENIALDIAAYLKLLNKDKTSSFYGMIDLNSIELEPITGIFDNMFGWHFKYTLKHNEPMCFDATKWTF